MPYCRDEPYNIPHIKNMIYLSLLEYFILTRLKAMTIINRITLQYQATGAKSKQYRRITPTIPCVRRFFNPLDIFLNPQ